MAFQKIDMQTPVCCGTAPMQNTIADTHFIIGRLAVSGGEVPLVSTRLSWRDHWGTFKARWDINRMNYLVQPGLYGVGNPTPDSPVLVSANYKMSFDYLRRELCGIDAWILVIDTKGVNVWCAAGKGTFGTEEIVRRIDLVNLAGIVAHRTIIVPQLGAPGVSGHKVKQQSGFKVVYGPVRAADLPVFIKSGMKASPAMRQVNFDLVDRLVLTPVELVGVIRPLSIAALLLLTLQVAGFLTVSWDMVYPYLGAILTGAVGVPLLLPIIPGCSFAWKGWLLGAIWALLVIWLNGWQWSGWGNILQAVGYLGILPVISAYLALNFTGASTYTSLSGVQKEMKTALPAMAIVFCLGIAAFGVVWIVK
ncbi:MAG: mercury methylation corrinoid protein HgcA [Deltaproteobacteria bacterium]